MLENIIYYIKRAWYFMCPKIIHIVDTDILYDGKQYMFLLEDNTLLQFEDFDCEEECFRFLDGSRYYPIMQVIKRDEAGNPTVWETVAFIRK